MKNVPKQTSEEEAACAHNTSTPPFSDAHSVCAGPIHSKVISNPIGFPGSRQFSRDTTNILKAETSGKNICLVTQCSCLPVLLYACEGCFCLHIFNVLRPFLLCPWYILVFVRTDFFNMNADIGTKVPALTGRYLQKYTVTLL